VECWVVKTQAQTSGPTRSPLYPAQHHTSPPPHREPNVIRFKAGRRRRSPPSPAKAFTPLARSPPPLPWRPPPPPLRRSPPRPGACLQSARLSQRSAPLERAGSGLRSRPRRRSRRFRSVASGPSPASRLSRISSPLALVNESSYLLIEITDLEKIAAWVAVAH
jgi:hypothetical protein